VAHWQTGHFRYQGSAVLIISWSIFSWAIMYKLYWKGGNKQVDENDLFQRPKEFDTLSFLFGSPSWHITCKCQINSWSVHMCGMLVVLKTKCHSKRSLYGINVIRAFFGGSVQCSIKSAMLSTWICWRLKRSEKPTLKPKKREKKCFRFFFFVWVECVCVYVRLLAHIFQRLHRLKYDRALLFHFKKPELECGDYYIWMLSSNRRRT